MLSLPERPLDRADETTQPRTEPWVEREMEFAREKCSICETKILFGVLFKSLLQITGLCFYGLLIAYYVPILIDFICFLSVSVIALYQRG